MKILITSASSFVGRYIAKKLLLEGNEVTGTYRTHTEIVRELEDKYKMKSIKNYFSFTSSNNIFYDNFDVIINCSGAFINGSSRRTAKIEAAKTRKTDCQVMFESSAIATGGPII